MHGYLLLIHILAATIWTGGHIILATTVLPAALRARSPEMLLAFEKRYERIGLPALLVQVLTGIEMARGMLGSLGEMGNLDNPVARLVLVKLALLGITVIFAADARLRLIPRLRPENMTALAWHIIPVTLISIAFVVVGVSFRTGWFY